MSSRSGAIVLDVETPTVINEAIRARVFDPERTCLVVSRGSILDVFDMEIGVDKEEETHLSHTYRLEMNARIDSIATYAQDEMSVDKVLVLCGVTVVCLSWCPITRTFSTESVYPLVPQGFEYVDTSKVKPQIVMDQLDGLAAVLFGQDLDMIAILPLNGTGKAFSIPLLNVGVCHARRIGFIRSGTSSAWGGRSGFKAHLAVLFDERPTSVERYAVKKVGCSINVYNVNLLGNTLEQCDALHDLPFDSYDFFSVPDPVGGLVVLTPSGIIHSVLGGETTVLILSHYFERSSLKSANFITFSWRRKQQERDRAAGVVGSGVIDIDEEVDLVDDYLYELERQDTEDVQKENMPFIGERATPRPAEEILIDGAIGVWLSDSIGPPTGPHGLLATSHPAPDIADDSFMIPFNANPTMFLQDRRGGTYLLKLKGENGVLSVEDGLTLSFVRVSVGVQHRNLFGSWATYPSKTILYLGAALRRAINPHTYHNGGDDNDGNRYSENKSIVSTDTGTSPTTSITQQTEANRSWRTEFCCYVFLGGDDGVSQILSLAHRPREDSEQNVQEQEESSEKESEMDTGENADDQSTDVVKKASGSPNVVHHKQGVKDTRGPKKASQGTRNNGYNGVGTKKHNSRLKVRGSSILDALGWPSDTKRSVIGSIQSSQRRWLYPFVGKWVLSKALTKGPAIQQQERIVARPIFCLPTVGVTRAVLYEPEKTKQILSLAKHGLFTFRRGNIIPALSLPIDEPSNKLPLALYPLHQDDAVLCVYLDGSFLVARRVKGSKRRSLISGGSSSNPNTTITNSNNSSSSSAATQITSSTKQQSHSQLGQHAELQQTKEWPISGEPTLAAQLLCRNVVLQVTPSLVQLVFKNNPLKRVERLFGSTGDECVAAFISNTIVVCSLRPRRTGSTTSTTPSASIVIINCLREQYFVEDKDKDKRLGSSYSLHEYQRFHLPSRVHCQGVTVVSLSSNTRLCSCALSDGRVVVISIQSVSNGLISRLVWASQLGNLPPSPVIIPLSSDSTNIPSDATPQIGFFPHNHLSFPGQKPTADFKPMPLYNTAILPLYPNMDRRLPPRLHLFVALGCGQIGAYSLGYMKDPTTDTPPFLTRLSVPSQPPAMAKKATHLSFVAGIGGLREKDKEKEKDKSSIPPSSPATGLGSGSVSISDTSSKSASATNQAERHAWSTYQVGGRRLSVTKPFVFIDILNNNTQSTSTIEGLAQQMAASPWEEEAIRSAALSGPAAEKEGEYGGLVSLGLLLLPSLAAPLRKHISTLVVPTITAAPAYLNILSNNMSPYRLLAPMGTFGLHTGIASHSGGSQFNQTSLGSLGHQDSDGERLFHSVHQSVSLLNVPDFIGLEAVPKAVMGLFIGNSIGGTSQGSLPSQPFCFHELLTIRGVPSFAYGLNIGKASISSFHRLPGGVECNSFSIGSANGYPTMLMSCYTERLERREPKSLAVIAADVAQRMLAATARAGALDYSDSELRQSGQPQQMALPTPQPAGSGVPIPPEHKRDDYVMFVTRQHRLVFMDLSTCTILSSHPLQVDKNETPIAVTTVNLRSYFPRRFGPFWRPIGDIYDKYAIADKRNRAGTEDEMRRKKEMLLMFAKGERLEENGSTDNDLSEDVTAQGNMNMNIERYLMNKECFVVASAMLQGEDAKGRSTLRVFSVEEEVSTSHNYLPKRTYSSSNTTADVASTTPGLLDDTRSELQKSSRHRQHGRYGLTDTSDTPTGSVAHGSGGVESLPGTARTIRTDNGDIIVIPPRYSQSLSMPTDAQVVLRYIAFKDINGTVNGMCGISTSVTIHTTRPAPRNTNSSSAKFEEKDTMLSGRASTTTHGLGLVLVSLSGVLWGYELKDGMEIVPVSYIEGRLMGATVSSSSINGSAASQVSQLSSFREFVALCDGVDPATGNGNGLSLILFKDKRKRLTSLAQEMESTNPVMAEFMLYGRTEELSVVSFSSNGVVALRTYHPDEPRFLTRSSLETRGITRLSCPPASLIRFFPYVPPNIIASAIGNKTAGSGGSAPSNASVSQGTPDRLRNWLNIGILAPCLDGSIVSVIPAPSEVEKTLAVAIAANWTFLPTFDPRRSIFSPKTLTQYVSSAHSITSNSNCMSASSGGTSSSSGPGNGAYETLLLSANQIPKVSALDSPASTQVFSDIYGWTINDIGSFMTQARLMEWPV